MSRPILDPPLFFALKACGDDGPTDPNTPPPPPPPPPPANLILVDGYLVDAQYGYIVVAQQGVSITDASMVIAANGVAATPSDGGFRWDLGTPLSPGALLTVTASRLGKTATIAAALPTVPEVVTPAANATFAPGTPLAVTWTSAADPAYYLVHIGYRVGTNGMGVQDSVAGSARSTTLSTAAIPSNATNVSIDIRAYGADTRSGDIDPGSRLKLFVSSEHRSLTVD
jgi:hypothetical protein